MSAEDYKKTTAEHIKDKSMEMLIKKRVIKTF